MRLFRIVVVAFTLSAFLRCHGAELPEKAIEDLGRSLSDDSGRIFSETDSNLPGSSSSVGGSFSTDRQESMRTDGRDSFDSPPQPRAGPSEDRPILLNFRLARLTTYFGSLQEKLDDDKAYAARLLSSSAIASMPWFQVDEEPSLRFATMDFAQQDAVLTYLKTRLRLELVQSDRQDDLVALIFLHQNPASSAEASRDLYMRSKPWLHQIDHGVAPSERWTDLQTPDQRVFDLGSLRFKMIRASTEPANNLIGPPRWIILAKPRGSRRSARASVVLVGRLHVPDGLF